MFGQFGYAAAVQTLPGWSVLFAREPESDVDLDDLPQGLDENPAQRFIDKKPPNRRPLIWILILVVVGVVAYALTQPDMLDLLGMGTPEPPKIATPAKPVAPSMPAAPTAPPLGTPAAPAAPQIGGPSAAGPGSSTPAPGATAPLAGVPPSAPPAPPVLAARPAPEAPSSSMTQVPRPTVPAPVPTPLFKEGQRVVVQSDPKQLTGTVFLSADAAGMVPGPLVKPGTTLTVTDGELRNNSWVYSVRTEDGAVGWIPESRLKVKS